MGFYHMIGDVGWIGFSSAYTMETYQPYLRAACDYMGSQQAKTIYLVAHWNAVNDGCQEGMDAPTVWATMKSYRGCDGPNFRYIVGHVHCNQLLDGGHGLMLGGS